MDLDLEDKDTITLAYRIVFGSYEGKRVLADILVNFCNFGTYIANEKERAQHDVAISILSRLGALIPNDKQSFIDAVLSIPISESHIKGE